MVGNLDKVHRSMARNSKIILAWTVLGFALLCWAFLLFRLSPNFSYAFEVPEMPIRLFVSLLVGGGVLFLGLPLLLRSSLDLERGHIKLLLGLILFTGLGMRLIFIFSEPMLEDDYQRYLWDGAQVARGLNPYTLSPEEAGRALKHTAVGRLATQSGSVLGRVNHGDLRTVYPPVAQVFFALAFKLAPFKLTAWRIVILGIDLVVLGLLFLLLRELGRSPLWLALYWWNPVVIKEFYNSAHMDILLIPFVLGAMYLAIKERLIPALASLAFGVGVKIWPAFLVPLVLRYYWKPGRDCKPIVIGLGLFAILCGLWLVPILISGLGQGSGFVAYASKWQTNSALFPFLSNITAGIIEFLGGSKEWGGRFARLLVIGGIGVWSLYLVRGAKPAPQAFILKCALLVLLILLLSPAQFPWYLTWFSPFLVFMPLWGGIILHALIPLYYLGFHYFTVDNYEFYTNVVVWLLWIPVWGVLLYELLIANKNHDFMTNNSSRTGT